MPPILKTKRLTLRPLSYDDLDAMVETIMSSKDVMRWLPCSREAATPDGRRDVAIGYLKDFIDPWQTHGFGVWAILDPDLKPGKEKPFIGYCGFLPGQIENAGPEIAFAIGKRFWGQGLVPEALTAGLDWIFKMRGIRCAYAVADKPNLASRRVLEKVGLQYKNDVDLYNSVANGGGLLPCYEITYKKFAPSADANLKPAKKIS